MNVAVTQLFQLLSSPVSMHNVGSTSVDEERLDGIILGEKELSSIPPSSDALHQKALHVAYQVNYIIIHKYVSHML